MTGRFRPSAQNVAAMTPGRTGRLLGTALIGLAMSSALAACIACPPDMEAYEPRPGEGASTQVGDIAEIVARERPDAFVGSALADNLDGPATLYVKGPRDTCIDRMVGAASVPMEVAYDQPFSFAELEARQQRVADALRAVTDELAIGFDITRGGLMEVVVARSDRLPDANAVMALVPVDLRDAVEVRVVAEDVVGDD